MFAELSIFTIFTFLLIFGAIVSACIKILPEWERGVLLILGRSSGIKGPGIVFIIPGVMRLLRVDTRTITMDIAPQDVITRDNVTLKVNAVIYFKIIDADSAITRVEDYYFATSQLAQTTMRSVLGQYELDDILSKRELINHSLQEILDKTTETWGLKVSNVELKNIDLPKEMQSAMARQAEAERERRAKIISAEGEFERAQKLKEASQILEGNPAALPLAYLQTLSEISDQNTKTVIFPVPIDILKPFYEKKD